MSVAVTEGVRVEAVSSYVADRSSPAEGEYFFAYTIRVSNPGGEPVRLVSRHWLITDDTGHIEEVRGPGVAGKQPTLKPGEAYRYASACPLQTTSGMMSGAYQMLSAEGELFEVEIPTFSLDLPLAERALN